MFLLQNLLIPFIILKEKYELVRVFLNQSIPHHTTFCDYLITQINATLSRDTM